MFQSQTFCAKLKDEFYLVKPVFMPAQKPFGAALNAMQFLIWPKSFGLAQNILEPVEGQDKKRNSHTLQIVDLGATGKLSKVFKFTL